MYNFDFFKKHTNKKKPRKTKEISIELYQERGLPAHVPNQERMNLEECQLT
jgi:hypothetical protein